MTRLECRAAAADADRHADNCAEGNPFALAAVEQSLEAAYVAYMAPACEDHISQRLHAAITLMEMYAE